LLHLLLHPPAAHQQQQRLVLQQAPKEAAAAHMFMQQQLGLCCLFYFSASCCSGVGAVDEQVLPQPAEAAVAAQAAAPTECVVAAACYCGMLPLCGACGASEKVGFNDNMVNCTVANFDLVKCYPTIARYRQIWAWMDADMALLPSMVGVWLLCQCALHARCCNALPELQQSLCCLVS
jgi:hypothetical protein